MACDWLYPTSNLSGIYGVFISGPIGLAIGAVDVKSDNSAWALLTAECEQE